MPKSPLDELKSLLRSRWVKPRYAVRALRELEDHLADLEAAARERGLSPADAQAVAARDLGDVRVIADQLVQGLQRHTSVGQHPWLVFGALPLPQVDPIGRGNTRGYTASARVSRHSVFRVVGRP